MSRRLTLAKGLRHFDGAILSRRTYSSPAGFRLKAEATTAAEATQRRRKLRPRRKLRQRRKLRRQAITAEDTPAAKTTILLTSRKVLVHGQTRETADGNVRRTAGGIVGGAMVTAVNGIIEKHGGLQGVISEFELQRTRLTISSWVGTGPNQPISTGDLQRALGPDPLQQLAAKSGMSVQDLAAKLAAGAAPSGGPHDAKRLDTEELDVDSCSLPFRLEAEATTAKAPGTSICACHPLPPPR